MGKMSPCLSFEVHVNTIAPAHVTALFNCDLCAASPWPSPRFPSPCSLQQSPLPHHCGSPLPQVPMSLQLPLLCRGASPGRQLHCSQAVWWA